MATTDTHPYKNYGGVCGVCGHNELDRIHFGTREGLLAKIKELRAEAAKNQQRKRLRLAYRERFSKLADEKKDFRALTSDLIDHEVGLRGVMSGFIDHEVGGGLTIRFIEREVGLDVDTALQGVAANVSEEVVDRLRARLQDIANARTTVPKFASQEEADAWLDERDPTPKPTVPHFSSTSEADAWMDSRRVDERYRLHPPRRDTFGVDSAALDAVIADVITTTSTQGSVRSAVGFWEV